MPKREKVKKSKREVKKRKSQKVKMSKRESQNEKKSKREIFKRVKVKKRKGQKVKKRKADYQKHDPLRSDSCFKFTDNKSKNKYPIFKGRNLPTLDFLKTICVNVKQTTLSWKLTNEIDYDGIKIIEAGIVPT